MRRTLLASTILTALAGVAHAQQTGCSAAAPNYSPKAGGFGVLAGQVYTPDGKLFHAGGINVNQYDMQSFMAMGLQTFPGLNFIRLAVFSYDDPSTFQAFINYFTARGVVVELEDHTNTAGNIGGGLGEVYTGTRLSNELTWYASVAKAYAGNPYVWFGTDNEPAGTGSALANWERQTYDAIRGAGNNSPILLEQPGGGAPGAMGAAALPAAPYATMTNVIWDPHAYPWIIHYTPDQNAANAAIATLVQQSQTIQSADGVVPVLFGETGQYDGTSSGGGPQITNAVTASNNGSIGAAFWSWNDSDPNNLQGTAYGDQVAKYIATMTSSGCAASPIPTMVTTASAAGTASAQTAPASTSAGSSEAITPGGQVTVGGTAWGIDANGNATANGVDILGGGGTARLEVINGVTWGLDDGKGPSPCSNCWFTLSGQTWTPHPGSTPPNAPALTVSSAPATAPPLAAPATAQTAPPMAPASTTATAPPLAPAPLTIDQIAQLAADLATDLGKPKQ